MTDKLVDDILATTYIQIEALSRLRALKDLILVQLFASSAAAAPGVGGQVSREKVKMQEVVGSPAQHTAWLTSLGPDFYKNFTRENVYKIFEEMENAIKKIQPLVIYVPFEIPNDELTPVGEYLRKNYGKRFLIETKIDPGIIAGTALVWKGMMKDYSIRKKIADNRETILRTLKSFVKH